MRTIPFGAITVAVVLWSLIQILPAAGQSLPPLLDCDASSTVTICDPVTQICTPTQVKNTIQRYLNSYTSTFWTGPSLNVRGTCNEGGGGLNVYLNERFTNVTLDGRDLRGDGRGMATVVGSDPGAAVIAIKARNVTLKGLNITGNTDGIQVYRGGTAVIDGVTVDHTLWNGIIVNQTGFARIVNSTIQYSGRDGILVGEGGFVRLGFLSGEDTTAQPNTITANVGHGIHVSRLAEARIVGNTIQNNGGDGVRVSIGSQAQLSANLINGNTGDAIDVRQNSGADLGGDSGYVLFDTPNATTVENGGIGIACDLGGYVDGYRGTLAGRKAHKFSNGCINSLK
jgi:parallel beta-helix repeat protein